VLCTGTQGFFSLLVHGDCGFQLCHLLAQRGKFLHELP
jgi:hypothetical protein